MAEEGASMGPRSNDRGNQTTEAKKNPNILLQWGRDQMIAEMSRFPTICDAASLLQWGRDQMIAEIGGG